MEAHSVLKAHNFNVKSYGVGGHVKLPGPSAKEPNVYEFGTPYQYIYNDLKGKDTALYTRNGLLALLERNMAVKRAPEKFQESREQFDVVVCFEERVMEQVVEDMHNRATGSMKPVLILNIDVKDNREEAAKVAPQTLQLCQMLESRECWEDGIDEVLTQFEQTRRAIYTVCYY
jgi:RNA polymerase II subunit A C-terminal domain phosphatase SSU72